MCLHGSIISCKAFYTHKVILTMSENQISHIYCETEEANIWILAHGGIWSKASLEWFPLDFPCGPGGWCQELGGKTSGSQTPQTSPKMSVEGKKKKKFIWFLYFTACLRDINASRVICLVSNKNCLHRIRWVTLKKPTLWLKDFSSEDRFPPAAIRFNERPKRDRSFWGSSLSPMQMTASPHCCLPVFLWDETSKSGSQLLSNILLQSPCLGIISDEDIVAVKSEMLLPAQRGIKRWMILVANPSLEPGPHVWQLVHSVLCSLFISTPNLDIYIC